MSEKQLDKLVANAVHSLQEFRLNRELLVLDFLRKNTAIDAAPSLATIVNGDSLPVLDSSNPINTPRSIKWMNTVITNGRIVSIGGAEVRTDLSIANRNINTLDILASSGDDITVPAVTTALSGLMTAAYAVKLDGIEALADVTDKENVGAAILASPTKATIASGDYITILDPNGSILSKVLWGNTYIPYTGAVENADMGIYAMKAAKFQLKTDAINTLSTGEMGWNIHDRTVEIKSGNIALQLGQEQNLPVQNNTGGTLLNGRLVRIVGHDINSEYYQVTYSDNSTEESAYVDFMLTEDIPDGGVGFGTKTGIVHDINTTGGTLAAVAYLGTNGYFQPTIPLYPNKAVVVGYYGHIDATVGELLVDFSRASQFNINVLTSALDLKAMQNPGICQMCPVLPSDIVIDTVARTLTIATIKGGEPISAANPVRFFTDGNGIITKHEKTAPVVFPAFTDTTGIWYFYFDSSGTPITSAVVWSDFSTVAAVYRLYWNSTLAGAAKLVVESFECHQNDMSAADHSWKHAQGSIYETGLDASHNFLSVGAPNADGRNTVVALSTGKCSDDGLEWIVTNTATPTAYFEQDLGNTTAATLNATNGALFKIRTNDAAGLLDFLPATRFPFKWNTVNNRPQYITTTGVATDVPDNNYMVYYLYNLSDRGIGNAIKLVSAATPFLDLTEAQAHSWETLRAQYATIKDNEIRPLYKLIFHVKHSNPQPYDVGCKYTVLRQVIDIRKITTAASVASAGSVTATNVVVAPVGTLGSTNAQSAFAELDDEKIPYTGALRAINLGINNLTVDTNTLFVDSVNHRLGFGTLTPGARVSFGAHTPGNYQSLLIYENVNVKTGLGLSPTDFRIFSPTSIDVSIGILSTTDGTSYDPKLTVKASGAIILSSLATASSTLVTASTTGQLGTTTNNSTNWDTAYTYSQIGHLPLSGGTMSNTTVVTNMNADLLDGQHGSYYAIASGSANYIQNQNASAQTANMWINGSGTFGGDVLIQKTTPIFSWYDTGGTVDARRFYSAMSGGALSFNAALDNGTFVRRGLRIIHANGNVLLDVATDNTIDKLQVNGSLQATTAKLTNLTDGYLPYHISDSAGLGNSNLQQIAGKINLFHSTSNDEALTIFPDDYTTKNTGLYLRTNQIASIKYVDGGTFKIKSQTNDYLTILPSGNVGIGTTTPSGKLDVRGVGKFITGDDGGLFVSGSITGSSSFITGGALEFGATSTVAVIEAFNRPSFGAYDLILATSSNIRLYTNNSEQLRILANGNVGIGTTDPPLKLSLLSNINTNNTTTPLIFLGSDRVDAGASINCIRGDYSSEIGLGFSTIFNAAATERVTIRPNGNVGIGTTNPQGKLDVFQNSHGSTAAYFHTGSETTSLTISGAFQRGYGVVGYAGSPSDAMVSTYGSDYRKTGGAFFASDIAANGYRTTGVYSEAQANGSQESVAFKGAASGATDNYGIYVTADKNYFSGNVGVGTPAPNYLLTLKHATNPSLAFETPNYRYQVGVVADDGIFRIKRNDGVVSDRLVIDFAGNVGIGTTAPQSKLDVFGTTAGSVIRASVNDGAGSADFGYGLYVANTSHEIASVNGYYANSGGGGSGHLLLKTRLNGVLSEKVRITDNGNIGIGTTSPSAKLHIESTQSVIKNISTTGTNRVWIEQSNTGGNLLVGLNGSLDGGLLSGSTAYSGIIGTTGAYPLSFGTTAIERMRITATGNIGIGTTAPITKLQISTGFIKTNTTEAASFGIFSNEAFASNPFGIGVSVQGATLLSDRKVYLDTQDAGLAYGGSLILQRGNGKVGIGTTAPITKLHVQTGLAVGNTGIRVDSNVANAYLNINDDALAFYRYAGTNSFFDIRTYNVGAWGANPDAGAIKLSPNGAAVLTATVAGNVGIGTTNPSFALDVNGTIRSLSAKFTTGATDGYFWKCTNADGSGAWAPVLSTQTVQALTGTNPYWDASLGTAATITLSGNTNIVLANMGSGDSGTLFITNPASIYKIKFSGYNCEVGPNLDVDSIGIACSGSLKYDTLSWFWTGSVLVIHGNRDYSFQGW